MAWVPFLDICHLVDSSEYRASDHEPVTYHSSPGACGQGDQSCLANGREIHLEQVAHLIDRPIEEVRRALALNEHISSLDAPLEIDPNHTVADAISDDNVLSPESMLQSSEVCNLVREWVEHLPEKQRRVLERRYGLGGVEIGTRENLL